MKYTLEDQKVFQKKGEAVKWTKKQKEKRGAAGTKYKIETNYLDNTGQWEGVVYRKMEEE